MNTRVSGTPNPRSTVARGFGWLTVSGMLAFALLGPTAGVVSADPGSPNGGTGHDGNNIISCPDGSGYTSIFIDGPADSTTLEATGSGGGVTITVTYPTTQDSLSFAADGGLVYIAYVKGGDAYNTYNYPNGTTTGSDLTAPNNGGGNAPRISHSVFCVTATPPSSPKVSTTVTEIHNVDHQVVTSILLGATVHDQATVSGDGEIVPTGTVSFSWFDNATCTGDPISTSDGGFPLVKGAVDATGFSQTPGAVGSYAFKATYSGDNTYGGSTGACEPLTVTTTPPPSPKVSTTVTEIHNVDHQVVTSILLGATVHDQATVSGDGEIVPTGTVSFSWFDNATCTGDPISTSDGGFPLVKGAVDATGFSQTPGAVGSYAFKATYSGDNTYGGSTGDCEPLTVTRTQTNPPTPVVHFGGLIVAKTLAGDLTGFAGATFTFTVACSNLASQTVSIAASSGTTSAPVISGLLPGTTCTVTENTPLPDAGGSATWASIPGPVTVTIVVDQNVSATITNTRVSGGVAAATGTPQITPPATNSVSNTSTPASGSWRLILLAMAGLLASLLILTPARARNRR